MVEPKTGEAARGAAQRAAEDGEGPARRERLTVLLAAMSLSLGGAETHVVALAKELSRRGHRVLVASQGGTLTTELTADGIVHYSLPLASRRPWQLRQAIRGMRRIITEEDVELIHAHARIPAWVAEAARRGRGGRPDVPLVTTYHAVYRSGPWWRLFTRFGDHTIAVSEDIATYVSRSFGYPRGKIAVIPNGLDTDRFSPRGAQGGERLEQEMGLRAHSPLVVHVSRLDELGMDRPGTVQAALALVRAAPALLDIHPDLRMVIVGDGREGRLVREAAGRVNGELGRQVVLCPGGRTDTPGFFALASVVVGVARVALEGMASGKPVVIAGEGGFRGLVQPDNLENLKAANFTARGKGETITPEKLVEAIGTVLANDELADSLGRLGRRTVEAGYSVGWMVDEILKVYRLCRRGGKGAARQAVILGYYGFGNSGDEALLQGILQSLEEVRPTVRPVVLSASPRETREAHGVDAVHRYNLPAVWRLFRRADVFISGGGTLLQDRTSLRSLWYYAGMAMLAKRMGLKVAFYANGLGPLESATGRYLARRALQAADLVTWRDHGSMETAKRLRMLPTCPWEVTADPAFLLEPAPEGTSRELLRRAGISFSRPVVGVSLRPWEGENAYLGVVATAADWLIERGYDIIYLPFQHRRDERVCRQALGKMRRQGYLLPGGLGVSELLGILGQLELVLGMRLHAVVLAATQGVPGVGLSYDPKVEGVLREMGGPMAGRIEKIKVEDIVAAVEKTLAERSATVRELAEAASRLRVRAARNAQLLSHLLAETEGAGEYVG